MFGTLSYNKQKLIIIVSFLLIPLLLLATFTYYPAIKLVYYSFTNWDGYSPEALGRSGQLPRGFWQS